MVPRECVVCVHGLYMNGLEMGLLRLRLQRCGYQTRRFIYRSWREDLAVHAVRLNQFLQGIDAAVLHLVGHSLGGLVIQRMLVDFPAQRPGRVVTLGTPHLGSIVAQQLRHRSIGRVLLGRAAHPALLGAPLPWPRDREIGVIAGSLGIGLGILFGGLAGPHDGTVSVAETRLPEARAHAVLPVSHMGLLFSAVAARQVCSFLHAGRFREPSEDESLWHA